MADYSFKKKLLLAVLPTMAAWILRCLAWTWRVREINAEGIAPKEKGKNRYIYAFWHGQLLPVVGYFRGSDIQSMASQSFDGEIVSRAMVKLGYPAPARGSSSRGGRAALKNLAEGAKRGNDVALTPDGPRGPRHQAHKGALALARLADLPVVPVAFRCSPVIRLRGWDRMDIPLPFARGRVLFGKPFAVGRRESEAGMERLRARLQKELNALDEEAGNLLENGK